MTSVMEMFAMLGAAALFFGCFGAIIWIGERNRLRIRRLEHAERIRLIERGMLDEVALTREKTEADRVRAIGNVGVVVPLATITGAVLVSYGLLTSHRGSVEARTVVLLLSLAAWVLAIILVGFTVSCCLRSLKRKPVETGAPPPTTDPEPQSPGVQDQTTL